MANGSQYLSHAIVVNGMARVTREGCQELAIHQLVVANRANVLSSLMAAVLVISASILADHSAMDCLVAKVAGVASPSATRVVACPVGKGSGGEVPQAKQ